jgi:uncharacterized repeat protein (TIGR03843 family)
MTKAPLTPERVDEILQRGELKILGRLVDASNATLMAEATLDDDVIECVYKPAAGERPLWDFPHNDLANREVATALLSRALGWDLVPRTVLREAGPYGGGMAQQWIDVDVEVDYVDVVPPDLVPEGWRQVLEARDGEGNPVILVHADVEPLQRLTVLDAICNNGDRKGGHVIAGPEGAVFGIDHGVTWHVDDKLRTVLWGWADSELPDDLAAAVEALLSGWSSGIGLTLKDLLPPQDIKAARARAVQLLETGRFPLPSPEWPAIPWPVF